MATNYTALSWNAFYNSWILSVTIYNVSKESDKNLISFVVHFFQNIRAVAYRWLARWLFGYMGPENTRPLSACIYENIRTRYNTGGATGYSDAAERS